jgi:hypothetical protein
MKKIEVLAKIIKEAKITSKEFKDQNGNSSLRISNKEMLLWLIGKQVEQDEEILKLRTKVKMLIVFLPITITLAILL